MKITPHYLALAGIMLVGCVAAPARAQSEPDAAEEVMAVVQQLFDGMRAGDSTAVRAVFDEGARMQSISRTDDGVVRRAGSVDRFVAAVGRPHEMVWDERIWGPVVQIDGPMAVAWTPYAFYHGDTLSHCGVNAFHLIRRPDGWKIFHLADTRRQEGCEIPTDVQK